MERWCRHGLGTQPRRAPGRSCRTTSRRASRSARSRSSSGTPSASPSATIRNDMAQLEEEELIAAPHTSSGRVPTDKGYRVFVDQLTELRPLTPAQRQAIETFLDEAVDLDDVLARTVRLLSHLTSQVALAQYPTFGSARVRHVELVTLGPTRLMTVLITDTGRVDQRLLERAAIRSMPRLPRRTARRASTAELAASPSRMPRSACADSPAPYPPGKAELRRRDRREPRRAGRRDPSRPPRDGRRREPRAHRERLRGQHLSGARGDRGAGHAAQAVRRDGDRRATASRCSIGRENASFGLGETSVLTSGYSTPGGSVAAPRGARPDPHGLLQQHGRRPRGRPLPDAGCSATNKRQTQNLADHYEVLGVERRRDPGRDQEGVPQARARAAPRRQPERRGGRALQAR